MPSFLCNPVQRTLEGLSFDGRHQALSNTLASNTSFSLLKSRP